MTAFRMTELRFHRTDGSNQPSTSRENFLHHNSNINTRLERQASQVKELDGSGMDFEASNENPALLYSLLPLKSGSHFRRTANWTSSTLVKTTPTPTLGKTKTTLPRAVNEALA